MAALKHRITRWLPVLLFNLGPAKMVAPGRASALVNLPWHSGVLRHTIQGPLPYSIEFSNATAFQMPLEQFYKRGEMKKFGT